MKKKEVEVKGKELIFGKELIKRFLRMNIGAWNKQSSCFFILEVDARWRKVYNWEASYA